MPKLIIGLVGRAGSGKGTAAKLLQESYGATLFRFSTILGDVLDRLAVDRSRDNLIKISNAVRGMFGEDVLAYAIEKDAVQCDTDIVVIDGIRRVGDIVALEPLPQFTLIEVIAPTVQRFERMKMRGEKTGENNMTWEEFTTQDNAPTEITIPEVAARAQYTIDNSGSAEDLKQQVDELMTKLLK